MSEKNIPTGETEFSDAAFLAELDKACGGKPREKSLPVKKEKSPLEYAISYAKKEYSVFPCMEFPQKHGNKAGHPEKRPYTKNGFKDATTDENIIREYWKRHPKALIGIACGEASGGLVVLDLDKDKTKHPDDFLDRKVVEGEKELLSLLGTESLPNTYTVETWSGGLQLYFSASKEQLDEIPNHNREISPNIDVKARGGYVIAANSRIVGGIGDGRKYTVQKLTGIAPLPDNIFQLIRKQKRNKASKTESKPTVSTVSANKLHKRLQKYSDDVLKAEIDLLASTREGNRNGQLNTTSFNLGTLVARGLLDENTVISELEKACHLNHYIEDDGYTSFQNTVQSGLTDGKSKPRELEPELEALFASNQAQVAQAGRIETPPQWEKPIPFDDFTLPSPRMDCLPPLISDYCQGLAEEMQVPVELPLTMTLAAGAIAAQGRFETEIRPGYREQLSLYLLCLLEPGNRKTAVVSACKTPIAEYEREIRQSMQEEVERQESIRKTREKIIERMRNDAVRKEDEEREVLEQKIYELEKSLPKRKPLPRLLVDNVTPEALAPIMQENDEQVGILEGEGGIFNILAGQYNKGFANIDLILKAHSGESVRVDRRGSEAIVLHYPRLSLGLSVQPIVLTERLEGKAFRERGLDARFLYALPKSTLGRRKAEPTPMPKDVRLRYQRKIRSLLETECRFNEYGEREPHTLLLTPKAYGMWLEFTEKVEKELDGGEYEAMKDWAGKFPGAVIRLASVLHVMSNDKPENKLISDETMNQAIDLGLVFSLHSRAAYGLMGSDDNLETAKRVLKWIFRQHVTSFKTQDCWQNFKRTIKRMDALKQGLSVLIERGYIAEKQTQKARAGRPSAPEYIVNPMAFEMALEF